MTFDHAFAVLTARSVGSLPIFRDQQLEKTMRSSITGDLSVDDQRALSRTLYNEYWLACKCDRLPAALRLLLFECALQLGPEEAVSRLQRYLNTVDNGELCEETLLALRRGDLKNRQSNFLGLRLWLSGSMRTPSNSRSSARLFEHMVSRSLSRTLQDVS